MVNGNLFVRNKRKIPSFILKKWGNKVFYTKRWVRKIPFQWCNQEKSPSVNFWKYHGYTDKPDKKWNIATGFFIFFSNQNVITDVATKSMYSFVCGWDEDMCKYFLTSYRENISFTYYFNMSIKKNQLLQNS